MMDQDPFPEVCVTVSGQKVEAKRQQYCVNVAKEVWQSESGICEAKCIFFEACYLDREA